MYNAIPILIDNKYEGGHNAPLFGGNVFIYILSNVHEATFGLITFPWHLYISL